MFDKDKILTDLGRLTGGAAKAASDTAQHLKDEIRTHVDDMAHRLDLVPRDEFERLEALLQNALLRIETLEGQNKPAPTKTKTTGKSPKKAPSKSAVNSKTKKDTK